MAQADEGPEVDEGLPANLGRSAVVMAVGTTLSRVTALGQLVAMAYASASPSPGWTTPTTSPTPCRT